MLSNPRGNSRAATFESGVPDDTLHYEPSFLHCGSHPFQFSNRVLEVFLGGLFSFAGGFQEFSFGAPDLEQTVWSGTEQQWAVAVPDFLQENNFELYCQELYFSDYPSHIETFAGLAAAGFEMSGSSSGPGGGIPLHEFRKDVPPGWAPGLPDYPLRLFFERLKLWYRIFDGADELVGPLVAGRLQGKAQRLGMQLRLVRPDGTYDVGSDALVRLSVEEVRDPANPAHVLQHAIPSGVQALCNSLKEAFGMSDQEIVSRSIEDFFEFRRGKLSFQEYAIEWDIRLEEATNKAGLELNDVAKFYLFFRGSGLPQRFVEDIKLQLQGDLRRYQDARTIALRLVTKKDDIGDSFYQGDSERGPGDYGDDDDAWSYWTDDSWSYVDEYEVESPYEDHWHDGVYYEDEEYVYDWPGDEAWNSWSGENDTEQYPAAEPDQVPEGQAQESFPMKGKGKGLGCTICGSRWHQSSSCPVGGGKNHKGSGKGKGKGKPYRKGCGKGYGKRPYKGKSKYGDQGWPGFGKAKGKGYYGYSAKTLVGSFGETSSLTKQPKAKTVHFQLDTEEPPVLNLGRPKASEDATITEETEDETSTATQSNLPEKRLDISFPTAIFNDHMSYHTVLGEKRRGLLVDPGAASGLVGSETLRDIMETCLPAARVKDVVWNRDKAQSVSGISGTPESTLGEVSFPLQLAGASGSFSADVLGGEGSLCPALLSNPSLRRQKAAVLCDYFTNGDGVLVVSDCTDGWRYLRILLTDSGHYLLPIDHHASVSEDTKKRVQTQMFTWNSAVCSRWPDVRHCFLQKRASLCREHERCDLESSSTSTARPDKHHDVCLNMDKTSCTTSSETEHNQDTAARTSSTTSGSCGEMFSDQEKTSCTTSIETKHNRDTAATSSTTSGSSKETSCTTSVETKHNRDTAATSSTTSGSFILKIGKSSGLACPFLDGPPDGQKHKSDSWHLDGEYLIRRHHVPRRALFTPDCVPECPVDKSRISSLRTTTVRAVSNRSGPQLMEDDWKQARTPCKDVEYLWTGATKFKLLPVPVVTMPSPPTSMATATSSEETALDPLQFPHYDGDHFPDHWSSDRVSKMTAYYRSIPEEYYSKSGRRPVTPSNFEAWMRRSKDRGLRFQFWEWCSGSGRLSLLLLTAHLIVGFPVDFRYGWDLGHAPHQQMLQRCWETFAPSHLFAAPSCTPWSIASSGKDPSARELERRSELPTLEFIHDSMMAQIDCHRGFTIEQPHGSAMLKDSPIARLLQQPGVKTVRFDQCMLGAQDESQQPVKKATSFLTNRRWRRVVKRCDGHRGKPHGILQGRFRGCSRTAMAAVYPKRLCQAVAQDLWAILRGDKEFPVKPWPPTLFGTSAVLYSCERCQLGRAAPPGCEHTMIPGECRMGQPALRAARAQDSVAATPKARPAAPAVLPDVPAAADAPSASSAPSSGPRMSRVDLEDITGPFKFLARSGDYSRINVEVHSSLVLNMEPRLYLKAALMQLVESCMDVFGSGPARDLEHWLTDPILMRVFQEIFADVLNVLGVKVCLRPWHLQVPDPHLSSACAPMRLLVSGHLRQWHVGPLEDMRVLSDRQLHAPVDEADWHVYVFGVCSEDYDADRPPPPGGSVLPRPSSSAPAAPLVPVEKKNDGKKTSVRPPDLDDEVYEPSEVGEQQEDEEFKAVRPDDDDKEKTLKPLFDFKKVYKRLQTDLLERDPHTAKRLLLGLHERFYHCPISDFKNMLLRAGLSSAVLPLAEEAVMSCSICRKYVRLPNRPQIKIGAGASSFNLRVQADLFMYKEQWILLMIDEATRYKAAGQVKSREHQELLNKMFEIWFVIFGAPYQLVLDQESSLMSHEAGKELERFSVERVPKGATAGAAAQQHTGTGLVERHVGLTEITMMKLSAEMDRQGIVLSTDTLARESVMSHNMSLNYGGATPSMAVFGIIPRPFYQDDSTGITAVTGALQTDVTPFEKALRIRQMSLSMVQRAVAEDRIARANRTRTQQLALEELIPGVTRVDFHRETQGDLGWRGPAELLKVNKDEGTAILSYQGRPYLVSLRHIRPHQAGVFVTFTDGQEAVFLELQQIVEKLTPYKTVTIGWVPITKDGLTIWHRASSTSLAYKDVWSKVVSLAKSLSTKPTGGAMAGQAVRSIHPPRGSVGVLILWSRGDRTYCCHEHNNDQPLSIKKVTAKPLEETTFLYVYFFARVEYLPDKDMKVIPSEGALEHQPMDTEAERPTPSEASTSGMDPMSSPALSSPPTAVADPMDVQEDPEDRKRKGPETRTVVLGPESKRSRVESLIQFTSSEKVTHRAQHVLVNLYWIMHWTQAIPTEFPMVWYGLDNNVSIALWDIYMARNQELPADDPPPHVHRYLFTWPGKQHEELYASLQDGQIFKVDSETDNITEDEMYQIWPQVEAADAAEIKQFVDTGSFAKGHVNALDDETVIVDAVWIRKWKRMPDGAKKVKSRLCARGCFDKQKDLLSTRSTTATRLSQRLLLSTAANEDLDAESWDISGAFLKGMNFDAVRRLLEQKGIKSPKRKIAIVAPANVWRHLASFDKRFAVETARLGDFILICLKPVYGLSDAPLAWQLCLHGHFEEQGGKPSLMDENSFYWCEPPSYRTTSMVTTHVDDCGAAGKPAWLKAQYELLVQKFGKVTRQQLPFDHCGVRYSKIADGFHMSQDDFCGKLRPAEVPKDRKDDDSLSPSELTLFRSILGGLLWLTATRLDLVADVCLLQSQVTRAKILHLRQANNVIKKAQSELGQGLGLHFRKLRRPHRLACIHDSSAAGNVRNYAQEGVLVLLCEDRLGNLPRDKEHTLSDAQCALMGGLGHILWAHGAKAKRISYSTSHAETLAGISGLEASTLVAVRIAEMFYLRRPASLQALLACQEYGVKQLPVDTYTDCRDFFELCSGNGNIPQDKNQRLYVLAYREARMSGRVRWMSLVPTQSMTADALTKSMLAPPMMELLSSGTTSFRNEENHPVILRSLPVLPTIEEKHFDMTDQELVKDIAKGFMVFAGCSYKQRFICMALLMTGASATSTSSATASSDDAGWYFMIAITLGVIIGERILCATLRLWMRQIFGGWSTTTATGTPTTTTSPPTSTSCSAPLASPPSSPVMISRSTSIDDEHRDKTAMLYIAGLEGENLKLRDKNKDLDRELRHVNELNFAQQAEIRRLQDDRTLATNASSTEELFCTVATGRTWHRNRLCRHLRGVNLRSMRPCADCSRTE